jgi:plasmid stabilization system protein ParE
MGRPARDLVGNFRRHEHEGHVIIYMEASNGILVVAVLNKDMRPELHL